MGLAEVLSPVNERFSNVILYTYWLPCAVVYGVFHIVQCCLEFTKICYFQKMYIYINSEFKDIKILYFTITAKRLPL